MTRIGPSHRVTVLYACNGCPLVRYRDVTDRLHNGEFEATAHCDHPNWEPERNILAGFGWPVVSMFEAEKAPIAAPSHCPIRKIGHFAPLEDRVAEIQSVALPEPGQ